MDRPETDDENADGKSDHDAEKSRLAIKGRKEESGEGDGAGEKEVEAQRSPKDRVHQGVIEFLAVDDRDLEAAASQHDGEDDDRKAHGDEAKIRGPKQPRQNH